MQQDFKNIQEAIGPDVAGIIWIARSSLLDLPRPFRAMDYLLDGLLTKLINEAHSIPEKKKNLEEHKHFFASTSFGNPFFVVYHNDLQENIKKDLFDSCELINSINHQRKKIIFLAPSSEDLFLLIKGQYPKMPLEILRL